MTFELKLLEIRSQCSQGSSHEDASSELEIGSDRHQTSYSWNYLINSVRSQFATRNVEANFVKDVYNKKQQLQTKYHEPGFDGRKNRRKRQDLTWLEWQVWGEDKRDERQTWDGGKQSVSDWWTLNSGSNNNHAHALHASIFSSRTCDLLPEDRSVFVCCSSRHLISLFTSRSMRRSDRVVPCLLFLNNHSYHSPDRETCSHLIWKWSHSSHLYLMLLRQLERHQFG